MADAKQSPFAKDEPPVIDSPAGTWDEWLAPIQKAGSYMAAAASPVIGMSTGGDIAKYGLKSFGDAASGMPHPAIRMLGRGVQGLGLLGGALGIGGVMNANDHPKAEDPELHLRQLVKRLER